MAVKRRVIWMTDENWDRLAQVVSNHQRSTTALGLDQKITPSLIILDSLTRGYFRAEGLVAEVVTEAQPERPMSERFNTRPFTPAPKVRGK